MNKFYLDPLTEMKSTWDENNRMKTFLMAGGSGYR
jgi:hypothetical protein